MISQERKRIILNIVKVMISKGMSLLSSLATGLLLPKLLGVTGYGYLKIYSLYMVYATFLHLGVADGILLRYAGNSYDSINRREMRTNTRFLAGLEITLGLVIISIGFVFFRGEYRFIAVMLGVNMVITNMMTYYQFIAQATQRFSLYSVCSITSAMVRIVLVGALFLQFHSMGEYCSYRGYLLLSTVVDAILLCCYLVAFRDISFGQCNPLRDSSESIRSLIRSGILLTISFQAAHLLLSLDRQFVSLLYDTDTYGLYAFSYNVISIFTTFISTAAVVFFPVLRTLAKDAAMSYYAKSTQVVIMISGACIGLIYPMEWFISFFLREYTGAITYLRILLPTSVMICCISIVAFTFFKVLDKNIRYFQYSLAALFLGIILNFLAQFIFRCPEAISWASVLTIIVWYLLVNRYFKNEHGVSLRGNFLYALSLMVIYYFSTQAFTDFWLNMIVFYALYFVISIIFLLTVGGKCSFTHHKKP